MTIAIFDIETNGLYEETTELHCISIKLDDGPTRVYTSRPIKGSAGSLKEGIDILNNVDLVVGHNIINFDLPTLEKLGYPVLTRCHDTLIMSRLAFLILGFRTLTVSQYRRSSKVLTASSRGAIDYGS